jgi:multiple sugar transport system ATP-binding protein
MSNIEIKSVYKQYSDNIILDNINLTVKEKELLVIVGPSGCGKTTLLRILAGLETADSGEVFIDGRSVTNLPPRQRGVAMVFQNYALYPHLRVFQNIAVPLKLRKLGKQLIKNKVSSVAKILQIEDLLNRKPSQLSGGQKQRVTIARAIVRDPKLLLLDEPFSGLDARLRNEMRTELSKLHLSIGSTTVHVTHDHTEAMSLGDKIVVMNKGRILQCGFPCQVYKNPSNVFVAQFIGYPKINILKGEIIPRNNGYTFTYNNFNLSFSKVPSSFTHQSQVIIGLRPENITLTKNNSDHNMTKKGIIKIIEQLGSETIIIASIDGLDFNIKVFGDIAFRIGDQIEFGFNRERVLFFDPETENLLGS